MVVVPGAAIPTGSPIYFLRETIPANGVLEVPECAAQGVFAATIVEGVNTLHRPDATRVWRGDGTVEDVPADTDMTLAAGDSYLALAPAPASTSAASGTEPAVMLAVGSSADTTGSCDAPIVPPGYKVALLATLFQADWAQSGLGAQGEIVVTFQRTTLAPGAMLVSTSTDPVIMRFVESGRLTETHRTVGSATPTSQVVRTQNPTIHWSPLAPDEEIVLSNEETEPAVLLEVVMTPADANATPAA